MRQRRRRTAFTDEQLDRLEESFEKERFPGIQIREDLARELNIGEDRIQVKQWINSVAYFLYANFNREYLDNSFVGQYFKVGCDDTAVTITTLKVHKRTSKFQFPPIT